MHHFERYPIFVACDKTMIKPKSFELPTFQIMSRVNCNQSWIYANNTNDNTLKAILNNKNDSLFQGFLFSLHLNMTLLQGIENNRNDIDYQIGDEDTMNESMNNESIYIASPANNSYPDLNNFSTYDAVLKHAYDLCGTIIQLHQRLYDTMTQFVHSVEINNNDNLATIQKQNKDYLHFVHGYYSYFPLSHMSQHTDSNCYSFSFHCHILQYMTNISNVCHLYLQQEYHIFLKKYLCHCRNPLFFEYYFLVQNNTNASLHGRIFHQNLQSDPYHVS